MQNATEYTVNDALREIGGNEWSEPRLKNHFRQCGLGDIAPTGILTEKQVASVKVIVNRANTPKTGQLKPVTDDTVLDLAESKGFDLDELMQAAINYQFQEDLVLYVESLQSERRRLSIERAAKIQAQSEDLEYRNGQLVERLERAVKGEAPDIDAIRSALGVQNSTEIQQLSKARAGKDFLSLARQATGVTK